MRALRVVCTVALLGLGTTLCGETGKPSAATSRTVASAAARNDENAEGAHVTTTSSGIVYDGDDGRTRFFGHEAAAPDTQAITTLVKRYYAAGGRQINCVSGFLG